MKNIVDPTNNVRTVDSGPTDAERSVMQAAAMSMMSALASVIAEPRSVGGVLADLLVHCLDAAGLSTGVLYLRSQHGLRLHGLRGLTETGRIAAERLFDHPELFDTCADGQPAALDKTSANDAHQELLRQLGHDSALIVPFVVLGKQYGSLLLSSDRQQLNTSNWLGFARILAVQFGQVVALGQAMSEIAQSEALFRSAVDGSPAGLVMVDAAGVIVLTNRQTEQILGYRGGELIGRPLDVIVPAKCRAHAMHRAEFMRKPEKRPLGHGRDLFARHKDGHDVPVEIGLAPVVRDDKPYVLATLIDITDRKRSEQRMAEATARIQALMDHANDGISVITMSGIVLETNSRMADILRVSRGDLIGKPISQFDEKPNQAKADEFWKVVAEGTGVLRNAHMRRADGTIAIVDFSIARVVVDGQQLILSIGRDVTEDRALEQQFLQAQKMEAVGRLAGGVAHDFNNVLTAILGHVELLKGDAAPDAFLRTGLEEIEKAGHRAAGLTRQLLAFSRQQVLQPKIVQPNVLIDDLNKMLLRLVGEDIAVKTNLASNAGSVMVDPGQFEQVVMNLVINARDAMPTGGEIRIDTGTVEITAADDAADLPTGSFVTVCVTDTGIGMTREVQARIFEPFFTTKAVGKGTGLGLSTVYGIVRQSGGHIKVESEVGRGTAFHVYLPKVSRPEQEMAMATLKSRGSTGKETILVAEDDDMLRPLTKAVLNRMGYTVLEGSNASQALDIADKHKGTIDLLITDVVMPGVSGRELAEQLTQLRPETRVLYISGYTDDAIMRHGIFQSSVAFLGKPFTPAELAAKVRALLDAA